MADKKEVPEKEVAGMTYRKIFLSFDGRIGRSVFWLKGMLPLFSISILGMGIFAGAFLFSLSMLGFEIFGSSTYMLSTSRGQVQVVEVTSVMGEEIKVVPGTPAADFDGVPFFEVNFDIALGDGAADFPKPLSFEKSIDAGSFRLKVVQTLDKDPVNGPIQWRIYNNVPTEPPSIIFFAVSGGLSAIVMAFLAYCSYAISCKRCHDRGRSGWFQLISLVPLIGAIWLFVELGILKGDEDENIFGPDPLAKKQPE